MSCVMSTKVTGTPVASHTCQKDATGDRHKDNNMDYYELVKLVKLVCGTLILCVILFKIL